MNLITHFLFGFLVAFVGSISPSMLNMTALKIRLQSDENSAQKYVLGVSLVVLFQTFIAVYISKYIIENPIILETIERFGIFIFILLAIYFYRASKKDKQFVDENKTKQTNYFVSGITLSILNMFAIPFFCGTVASLEVFNFFVFEIFSIGFFVLGSAIGTYYILFLYVKYATKIQQKTGKLTKDINLVLSVLTGCIAVFSIIKIVYKSI